MRDELFLEPQQRLQAARLLRIFGRAHLLQAHALDFLFQIAIFLAHPAQIEVVVPETADAALAPDDAFFQRSDGLTAQMRIRRVDSFSVEPLDLHRQPQHLGKQNATRMVTLR